MYIYKLSNQAWKVLIVINIKNHLLKFWSRANKSSANKGKHVINVTAAFQNQQVYRMPWIVHTVHDLH